MVKTIIDMTFAIVVIGFFWWVLLAIWLAIKCTSPGPALFAQQRVGQHGRIFTCYKFRTMHEGVAQAATHEMSSDAITPLGHFLRKTKLDELPQIINILRDEMSLVGPRPSLTTQQELISARQRLGVLEIKPGITGLAQIRGVDMRDPEKLAKIDAEYASRQNLLLDLQILWATLRGTALKDRVSA